MYFLIDVVARWFARWDDGLDVDLDSLASPDRTGLGVHAWSPADGPIRRPAA